jgi:hypothetical protein
VLGKEIEQGGEFIPVNPGITQRLRDEEILSIVIGGLAVAAWGEPRLTRGVDLKVLLSRQDANRLLDILSSEYVSLTSQPKIMLKRRGLLFVQDSAGTRLDIMLADTPYDILAIERGRDVEVQPGVTIRVCSPEDLIIYKIISTQLRDHEDVQGVVRRQGDALDDDYVLGWLNQFEEALADSAFIDEYKRLRREDEN